MKQNAWLSWRMVGGGVLLVAVAAVLWHQADKARLYRLQIANRMAEMAEVNALAAETARRQAVTDGLADSARTEDRVRALMDRHLGGTVVDLVLRDEQAVDTAWRVRRYDVRMELVESVRLAAFLAACENARPPVRLLELQVNAVAGTRPLVQAQLSLAELSRNVGL